MEEEIAICRMHGFAAEQVMEDPPTPWVKEAPTGKRIAVVGAGPSGLTAAYYLALQGHYVKVFDMMPQSGGMLRYGIPEYRLPKDMVDKEFEGVWKLGVDVQYNVKLGRDFTIDDLEKEGFDATLLAIGAWTSNELGLEGQDNPGVVNAIAYLMDKTQGLPVPVDDTKEVVVLGGGFTTFDCTRTSLRLGAKVHTVYRRGRGEMTATTEEVEDGENEGTDLQLFGAATKLVLDGDKLTGIEIQRMQLGEPDASGRRRPVPIPGSEYTHPVRHGDPRLRPEAGQGRAAAGVGCEVDEVLLHRDRPVQLHDGAQGRLRQRRLPARRGDDHRGRRAGQAGRARD